MKKIDKKILELFQCEYNRNLEETFASVLSERNDVRLFFVNENQAFTDGKNIVVDPANDELFCDIQALIDIENYLKIEHSISNDKYKALRMVTRCQNVHETLHLIYTTFPLYCTTDSRATTKMRMQALSSISNIIEDAFIEAAGASEFDNMALFLMWGRVSRLFANTPSEGTVQKAFKQIEVKSENDRKLELFMEFLNYFVAMLLYPMVQLETPSNEISGYIEKTKDLFKAGSVCGDSEKRYEYTQKIFDIITPLIPEAEEKSEELDKLIERLLGAAKTHDAKALSIAEYCRKGKTPHITTRLFADKDGKLKEISDLNEQYQLIAKEFENDKQIAISFASATGTSVEYSGGELKASAIHKSIKVKVNRPKPDLNMKKAYQNIYNKYNLTINSYNAKFRQLLKGMVESKEDKFAFGSGIASKRLGDVKKRYWYRNVAGMDVPDIAVLFLIDGSGSMDGMRCESARNSSVILHEVLKKNDIAHAIVEHRAIFEEDLVEHNVLVDFHYKENDKFNILNLNANDCTREGLSLYWAEKYITENSNSEYKAIVVISDGLPYHVSADNTEYAPPVSTKDTANAARKIIKRGTEIIAVALDEKGSFECYQNLKEIYPNVIACDDLKQLTGKLLSIVSKLLA